MTNFLLNYFFTIIFMFYLFANKFNVKREKKKLLIFLIEFVIKQKIMFNKNTHTTSVNKYLRVLFLLIFYIFFFNFYCLINVCVFLTLKLFHVFVIFFLFYCHV